MSLQVGEKQHRGIVANDPVAAGVEAGSERQATAFGATIGARLTPSLERSFLLNTLVFNNAIVPGSVFLNMRCKAYQYNGVDISTATPIALIEGCSSLAFRGIKMYVNEVLVSRLQRADVVRHVVDRTFNATKGLDLEAYRQLNSDHGIVEDAATPAVTDIFKHGMIEDGQSFLLTRPLDDLPFFADGDTYLPGWNTVKVDVETTSDPQNLFRTDGTITEAPYLFVEEMFITYTTAKILNDHALKLREAAIGDRASFSTTEWNAQSLAPHIDAGATSWESSSQALYDVTPNMVLFAMFPTATFTPSIDSYKDSQHPMIRSWGNVSDIRFNDGGGGVLQRYNKTKGVGGKIDIMNNFTKAIDLTAGVGGSTVGTRTKSAMEPYNFVREPGTGLIPLVFKNWLERDNTQSTSLTISMAADLNDEVGGAPVAAIPYLISATSVRWNLSPISGATQKTPGIKLS